VTPACVQPLSSNSSLSGLLEGKHERMASSRSVSGTDEYASPADARSASPHLFLAFACNRPFSSPRRYALGAVQSVALGREESATSQVTGDPASLRIEIADSWVSTHHAQLRRVMGRWIVEDLGSRNGTRLNGVAIKSSALSDGDVLELGHSFLVFRPEVKASPEGAPKVSSGELGSHPSLATLNPELAAQFSALVPLAPSGVSIVIQGETGTGKELVAKAIHQLSKREGEFIAVNCGAIPETLLEAELFGYQKGAFSGAVQNYLGLIRSADRGTLFLDEIGDLPATSQVSLLRVLQEREVMPLGTGRSVPVDIRICSASHRDLQQLVSQLRLREDLFGRISGFTINLPALRQRREDLGLIISSLLERSSLQSAQKVVFDRKAARAIFLYDWPRNIRELEKCLEAALALAGAGPISLDHLSASLHPFGSGSGGAGSKRTDASPAFADQSGRERLIELLVQHGGNVSAVARTLGKARVQVRRWLARHLIDPDRYRKTKTSRAK
jgi:DNA-binding NtrC family response regulator